jgi:hypothetical protein
MSGTDVRGTDVRGTDVSMAAGSGVEDAEGRTEYGAESGI